LRDGASLVLDKRSADPQSIPLAVDIGSGLHPIKCGVGQREAWIPDLRFACPA
jgi:hypothetical protein